MSQNKFESKQSGAKDGAEALSQNKFESKQSGEKGLNGSGG